MRASLVLADTGQKDQSGKIHLLGAGWSVTTVQANGLIPDSAVVIFIEAPWDRCNRPLPVVLELVTEDEEPVVLPVADGEPQPVRISHSIVAAPPPGAPNGSSGMANFLINLQGGLPLAPGAWYKWRLTLDGDHEPQWSVSFFVNRQQTMPTFGAASSPA